MTTKQSNIKQEQAQNTNDNYGDVKKNCGQCRQLMYIKWKCNTCSLDLCEPCKINHIKNKTSANHKVTALKQDDTKCHQHLSESVQMFCLDCQHLVCFKCISETHRRHDFTEIQRAFELKQREMKEQVAKLKTILAEDTNALSSVKKYEDRYISAIDISKHEIKEHNQKLKSDIDFLTTKLIEKINTKQAENIPIFQQQIRTIEKRSERLKIAINTAEGHLKSGDQLAVIKYGHVMEQILKQTKSLNVRDIVPPIYHSWKYDHEFLRPLAGYIDDDDEKASDCLDIPTAVKLQNQNLHKPYQTKILSMFDLQVLGKEQKMCIAATPDRNCWVEQGGKIVLMSESGTLKTEIESCPVYTMAVNEKGELLLSDSDKLDIYDKHGKYQQKFECINAFKLNNVFIVLISVAQNGNMLFFIHDGMVFVYCWINEHSKIIAKLISNIYFKDQTFFQTHVLSRLKDNGDVCFLPALGEQLIVCNSDLKEKFTYTGRETSQNGQLGRVLSARPKSYYQSLEVDTDGNILLGDVNNSTVELIDGEGNFIQYILTRKDGLQKPTAMSLKVPGLLWVYSQGNNKMFVVEYKK